MPRRRRRRRSMFASAPPRRSAGVPWLEPGHRAGGPRRRRRRNPLPMLIGVLVLAAIVAVVVLVVRHEQRLDRQRAHAAAYVKAWAARDTEAMWAATDAATRRAYPLERFRALQRNADRAATVRSVRLGAASKLKDGAVTVPAAVTTQLFGTLRATVRVPVAPGGVRWTPALRLPGLRPGETPRRRTLQEPDRASVLTAAGDPLDADTVLAPFAPGLRKRYAARLAGTPGAELRFGGRLIDRVPAVAGRSVRSTLSRTVQQAAQSALGSKLGGVALIRPSDGSVLALAGIAVSAPSRRARRSRSSPCRPPWRRGSPRRRPPIRSAARRRCRASSSPTRAASPAAGR
ncbi:hypothetical protein [Baekduia soli]|uniref:hypothetical protein n=1 Tax=Baekduia soli TaxID=496014 RepID=UPI001E367676|nr:hypothetical protein [Baekduia soli]